MIGYYRGKYDSINKNATLVGYVFSLTSTFLDEEIGRYHAFRDGAVVRYDQVVTGTY